MQEILFKLYGSLRDRRLDIVAIALVHLIWRLGGWLVSLAKSPFSEDNFGIALMCLPTALGILSTRFFTVIVYQQDGLIFSDAFAEFFIWLVVSYPALRILKGLWRLAKAGIWRTGLKLENYEPRKVKDKIVSHEVLNRLLEDNPDNDFLLADDGELIPLSTRKHR